MRGLNVNNKEQFDLYWSGRLSDYVSAIAWASTGKFLAASSAAGEVMLWQSDSELSTLQAVTDHSVDCLAFSHDVRGKGFGRR